MPKEKKSWAAGTEIAHACTGRTNVFEKCHYCMCPHVLRTMTECLMREFAAQFKKSLSCILLLAVVL